MMTDKLGFNQTSKPFTTMNIMGVDVEIREVKMGERVFYNAYAELKNSQYLTEKYLGYPTFRQKDWVGVDTAHAFNEKQTLSQKLASAMAQIESVIKTWKEAMDEEAV